jgi:hypothetical protein
MSCEKGCYDFTETVLGPAVGMFYLDKVIERCNKCGQEYLTFKPTKESCLENIDELRKDKSIYREYKRIIKNYQKTHCDDSPVKPPKKPTVLDTVVGILLFPLALIILPIFFKVIYRDYGK